MTQSNTTSLILMFSRLIHLKVGIWLKYCIKYTVKQMLHIKPLKMIYCGVTLTADKYTEIGRAFSSTEGIYDTCKYILNMTLMNQES